MVDLGPNKQDGAADRGAVTQAPANIPAGAVSLILACLGASSPARVPLQCERRSAPAEEAVCAYKAFASAAPARWRDGAPARLRKPSRTRYPRGRAPTPRRGGAPWSPAASLPTNCDSVRRSGPFAYEYRT